jgi:ligand-binding SRPBCC domain-containing protein
MTRSSTEPGLGRPLTSWWDAALAGTSITEFVSEQEQTIDKPLAEVFAFLSDAQKLPLLIPDWISFGMLNRGPVVMAPGTHIDYTVRLHGIPFAWQSEITLWDPPHRFVDEQRKGPYRWWTHLHTFEEVDPGRTIIRDTVRYGVPGGRLVNKLLVAPDLARIFAHRRRRLREIFRDGSGG